MDSPFGQITLKPVKVSGHRSRCELVENCLVFGAQGINSFHDRVTEIVSLILQDINADLVRRGITTVVESARQIAHDRIALRQPH